MFTVELYAAIRRAVMAEGLSRREAAKRFGVHRNTITKMLQYSAPPGYRRRERPVSKKLGPHMAWIDKVLADGARRRRGGQKSMTRSKALLMTPSGGTMRKARMRTTTRSMRRRSRRGLPDPSLVE
jgi:transposase